MDAAELITLGLSILMGGGGLVALYRARKEAPLITAQAQSIIIENLHAENARLLKRADDQDRHIQTLERRVVYLEELLGGAGD